MHRLYGIPVLLLLLAGCVPAPPTYAEVSCDTRNAFSAEIPVTIYGADHSGPSTNPVEKGDVHQSGGTVHRCLAPILTAATAPNGRPLPYVSHGRGGGAIGHAGGMGRGGGR